MWTMKVVAKGFYYEYATDLEDVILALSILLKKNLFNFLENDRSIFIFM